ncbi:MAG: chemotaxis protein [Firmicutes bacterium]|nr:chemotaxis protein [Bacillota bacterium]
MSWYYNLKISAKLIIGFIVVALLAGLIGVVGIVNIRTIAGEDVKLYEENTVSLNNIGQIQSEFLRTRMLILRVYLASSENKTQVADNARKSFQNLEKNIVTYEKNINSTTEKKEFENLNTAISRYKIVIEKYMSFVMTNQLEQAMTVVAGEGDATGKAIDASLQALYDMNMQEAKMRSESNTALASKTTYIMIVIVLAGMALAVGLGLFIARIISRPVNRIVEAADSIASGNLDVNLKIDTNDEVGSLGQAFVKIIGALNNLVADSVMLAQAAREGKLSTRADASKHSGDYRKIVEGVNQTLEAITEPINEVKMVSGRMAINDYTVKVTGLYKGELHEFADAVNMVQNRLLAVQDVVVRISLGDLSRLDEYLKVGKRSEHDKIVPAFIGMMQAIRNLINETGMLADAAINGKLEVRGDAFKFSGEYCDIINGFNKTLDAIGEPIKEATEVLGEMAEGNLCVEMQGDYKGSYALIKNSLNNTIQSFIDLLGNINEATDQVTSGSRQVSDGSQALSQGATEQASSVEQLTVSISQVATQTKDNAIHANQANELALKAKEDAEQGNLQMNKMLKSMEEINESSSKISKIIKVIDEIAFQTNILALNAAVEAARAGQHGKGFAVVAEEVRNLAARSANAAKETTALIEGSVKNVEDGTQTANGTAKALEEIVNGVARAASLVGDIASASNEQATAIAQINKGVEQVAQVIQTNSATAEESAAASEELSGQADMLKEMISKFRLQKETTSYVRYEKNEYPGGNKKARPDRSISAARSEAAATKNKPRIALSDKEFGKY